MGDSEDIPWIPEMGFPFDVHNLEDPTLFNADPIEVGGLDINHPQNEQKTPKKQACDLCHVRKIKCDGKSPTCSSCLSYHTECVYTPRRRVRKPRAPRKRNETLGNRLNRMESYLKELGLLDLDNHPTNEASSALHGNQNAPGPARGDLAGNSNMGDGDTLPSSSNHVEIPIGEKSLTHWIPEPFRDDIRRNVRTNLPPLPEMMSLIHTYFEYFNQALPLFDQAAVVTLARQHSKGGETRDLAEWAVINVVLALAYRVRSMSFYPSQDEDAMGWRYSQNALATVTRLAVSDASLLSVQAFVGMAMLLQGSPNPEPAYIVISNAIRLGHSIGLHTQDNDFKFGAKELEQRRRVFWLAYFLDKDISLRLNRPSAQHDDDIDQKLPSENPDDGLGMLYTNDQKQRINFLRLRVDLSRIQSDINGNIYTARARKRSEESRREAIRTLNFGLDEWESRIPEPFLPDNIGTTLDKPSISHMAVLHFVYFNCLSMTHRMVFRDKISEDRLMDGSNLGLNGSAYDADFAMIQTKCISAARSALRLVQVQPRIDHACTWVITSFYISGVLILLSKILHTSEYRLSFSDFQLVDPVLSILDHFAENSKCDSLRRMTRLCLEMGHNARSATQSHQMKMMPLGQGRNNPESGYEGPNLDLYPDTFGMGPTACETFDATVSTSIPTAPNMLGEMPISVGFDGADCSSTWAADPMDDVFLESLQSLENAPDANGIGQTSDLH